MTGEILKGKVHFYQIGRLLGKGAFGSVHIAETERQEKVAVKTVLRSRVNFLQGQDRTKLRGDLASWNAMCWLPKASSE